MPKVRETAEPKSPNRIRRNRRDKNTCPFCSSQLKRKTRTSRMKSCEVCTAQKDNLPESKCCRNGSVWRKGKAFRCFTCGKDIVPPVANIVSKSWKPLKNESPEDYVDRVGGRQGSNVHAIKEIMSYYGVEMGVARRLFAGSRSYWERFFLEHSQGIFDRDGSRYAALRFIQRKNEPLEDGDKMFSQEEIDQLIDSVGKWKR